MAVPHLDITPAPIDVDAEIEHLVGRRLADEFNQATSVDAATQTDSHDRAVITGYIGQGETAAGRAPRWTPTTESDAEWCMGRLAEAHHVLESLARQRDAYITRAQEAYWKQAAYWRRIATFFGAHLEQWGIAQRDEAMAAAEAAGRKTYPKTFHLPSGSVSTRCAAEPVAIIQADADLLAWARRECPDAVTTTRKVNVTDLRQHVALVPEPGDRDALIVVHRKVDDDGEVTLGTEPVPGAGVEWPRITATPHPHLPEVRD